MLIKDLVRVRNHNSWRLISALFCIYFLVQFALSFTPVSIHSNPVLYIILAVLMAAGCGILTFAVKPKSKMLEPVVYCLYSMILLYGIVLSTILSPDTIAVSTHVLTIALPLVLIEKPLNLSIVEAISVIIFCIVSYFTKSPDLSKMDIFNGIVFGIIAQIALYIMCNIRMSQLIYEQKLEIANTRDGLTKVLNRSAYEKAMDVLDKKVNKGNLVYIAMDINDLKTVNDNLGHAAGDELIIGAARCCRTTFGKYGKIYRTGGDEFAVIIHADDDVLETLKTQFKAALLHWSGNRVKRLTISCGYVKASEMPGADMHDISIEADKRMYNDKFNFYRNSGVDRRKAR